MEHNVVRSSSSLGTGGGGPDTFIHFAEEQYVQGFTVLGKKG